VLRRPGRPSKLRGGTRAAEKALALRRNWVKRMRHSQPYSMRDLPTMRVAVEYDRALALSPGNALVLVSGIVLFLAGRTEAAVAMPNVRSFWIHSMSLLISNLAVFSHRSPYRDAIEAYNRALSINPQGGITSRRFRAGRTCRWGRARGRTGVLRHPARRLG